jgi:hypothetical protein
MKHIDIILNKMCEILGADFSKMDFKKENWFRTYEWTEDSENDFKKWLISHLLENKEARDEIMEWPTKDKKNIEKAVNDFIFNYGWKTKT